MSDLPVALALVVPDSYGGGGVLGERNPRLSPF